MSGILPFVKQRTTLKFYNEDDLLRMTIVVDATERAGHKMHAEITNKRVARGQALSDNVRPEADVLSLVCYFSNRTGDAVELVRRIATADFTHAEKAMQDLEIAYRNQWRCSIDMRIKAYENMVIEDIDVPETVEDGSSIRATVSFKEIRTATAQTVQVTQARRTGLGAQKKVGIKSKGPPTPPQEQSAATRLSDQIGVSRNFSPFKKP